MANDEVALRHATPKDRKRLQRWLDEPDAHWLKQQSAEEMLDYYLRDRELARAYVIVIGGVDAGIITINQEDVDTKNVIDIDHMLIQENMRGRGYGRRALRCLLAMADWPQDAVIRTEINPKNTQSIKCFVHVGFVDVAHETDFVVHMEYRRSG